MSDKTPFWKVKDSVKLVSWPSPQDYNEAVQNPHISFTDAELRNGQPELTALGLPRPMTGAFASVYRLQCGERDWAVRCFLHNVADQNFRYEQISKKLKDAHLPYTAGFEFIEDGINVRSSWFPILKMEWVEGDSLISYIEKNLSRPGKFSELNERFHQMMSDLKAGGIAHGDLQHGNIIIENDQFRLVDYDGMFVSTLSGRGANELGHRNYQHPGRAAGHFGLYLDNFSAWVIHTTLKCLSVDPSLWKKLKAGDESLLFKQSDFTDPTRSRIFYELERHASQDVSESAKILRALLSMTPEDIPDLTQIDTIEFAELPDVVPAVTPPPTPVQQPRPQPRPGGNYQLPTQLEQSPRQQGPQSKALDLSLAVPIFIWSVVFFCGISGTFINIYSALKHQMPSSTQQEQLPLHNRLKSNSSLSSPLNQGHLKYAAGKWSEAASLYQEHIIQQQQKNWHVSPQVKNEIAEAEFQLGFCKAKELRFDQAVAAHMRALNLYTEIDPIAYAVEIRKLHNQLGIEYSRLGQFKNAAAHLETVLNSSGGTPTREHEQLLVASELLTAGHYMFIDAGANHTQQQAALNVMKSALKVLRGNQKAQARANLDLLRFSFHLKSNHKNAESQLIYALITPPPDRIVGGKKN